MTVNIGRQAALPAIWLVLTAISCTGAPQAPAADPQAVNEEYHRLQQQATGEIRSWNPALGSPDPRPLWADRLEQFAALHPGTDAAAEALQGVMEVRSASHDIPGFFRAYDAMLQAAPDSPGLAAVFDKVLMMRWIEQGGPGIAQDPDVDRKQAAYRKAVPKAVADTRRAIEATRSDYTKASAHYAIGLACFQLDVDLEQALEHFTIVAEKYPDWAYASSARDFKREIETLGPGKPAPDFEAVSLDGTPIRLSSLKGRIVLLDFWATWCQPCVHELPALRQAYERYRSQGFTIVGVSLDDDRETVGRFVAHHGMTWPIIAPGLGMTAPLARAYNIQAIPMSYLVDREGTIHARSLMGAEVERAVEGLVAR